MLKTLMGRPEGAWLAPALLACVLLLAALFVPLWRMELVAPQYPEGLVMYAYGYKFTDDPGTHYKDIREINGLNHYIGMKPIEEVTEMRLFIPGVVALAAGTLLVSFVAWQRRWLRALIVVSFWVMPLFFVADLQYWLYNYGHTMDPHAALDTSAFTPKILGTTRVWNFHSDTAFALGFYLMVLAALVVTLGPFVLRLIGRRLPRGERVVAEPVPRVQPASPSMVARSAPPLAGDLVEPALPGETHRRARSQAGLVVLAAAAFTLILGIPLLRIISRRTRLLAWMTGAVALAATLAFGPSSGAAEPASASSIAEAIAKASLGDTVTIGPGVYRERVVIDKPIALVGEGGPVIDGGGQGDVVTIAASGVTVQGFVVRNSGFAVSQQAAGIRIRGDENTIVDNRVEDVYYGVAVEEGHANVIRRNVIVSDRDLPAQRRGHGIYLWSAHHTIIIDNDISYVKDGIFVSFSDSNAINRNRVSHSRYGIHYMYSDDNQFRDNVFQHNLLGGALMNSRNLILMGNEFSDNRRGASGHGLLFKDMDDVWVQDNRLIGNRVGMSFDNTPAARGASAVLTGNLVARNDVGLALMSTAAITFYGNGMVENGQQVASLGGELASALAGHESLGPSAPGSDQAGHEGHGSGGANDGQTASTVTEHANYWSADGRGNYWSDYTGYDADGDGVGDVPYEPAALFAEMMNENPMLRAFIHSPAQRALDLAGRLFPVYRPEAVLTDQAPLMEPPTEVPTFGEGFSPALLLLSLLLLGVPAYVAWLVLPTRERGRRAAGLAVN